MLVYYNIYTTSLTNANIITFNSKIATNFFFNDLLKDTVII